MFEQKDIDKISNVFSQIKKRKYWIILPLFIAFILYFSEHSIYNQQVPKNELRRLKAKAQNYKDQILENAAKLNELQTNKENLEHFAREEYYMKRKNEDIFIVVASDTVK